MYVVTTHLCNDALCNHERCSPWTTSTPKAAWPPRRRARTVRSCSSTRSSSPKAETSEYFRAQPGFVSLKLHRAVSTDAQYRYVNVATWDSAAHYAAPHQTDEFRRL